MRTWCGWSWRPCSGLRRATHTPPANPTCTRPTPPSTSSSAEAAPLGPGTLILNITATGPNPEDSRALADAIITATAAEAARLEAGGTEPTSNPLVKVVPIDDALPDYKKPRRTISPSGPSSSNASAAVRAPLTTRAIRRAGLTGSRVHGFSMAVASVS